MKKLLSLLLALLMLFALTACQSQTPPAPEETTAQAPEQTTPPAATPEETKDTAKIDAIVVGPVEGKSAEDYQFACVPGGVNPYFDPMMPAVEQAAEELGIPAVEVQTPQHWEQNEQNAILDGLIGKGIDGVLMMPSNAVAGNEQITKMVESGVPVICVGGPPELPSKATLTLATDVYNSAFEGTQHLIEAIGKQGNIVGLSGQISDPNTQIRLKAIEDACAEHEGVTLLQTIGDIDNSEGSMTAVENLLAASGDDIAGIISTAYYPSVAIATYLSEAKYAHIKGVGIDTDEKVLQAIRDGHLLGTMSQNPWGQAYIATQTLKMLTDGWTYKDGQDHMVDSGSFFVNKENIDRYDEVKLEVTNGILETWLEKFNPPA